MAPRRWGLQVTLAVVVVVVTATATLSSAQQTAATAAAAAFFPALPSCPPAPLSLSPCIGYVFGVGSATLASCCSQLRGFLQAQAPCLCAASKLAPSPIGLFLGQAQAMLPNVCDLPNPCDADAGAGEGTTPPAAEAGTSVPSATTPAATATPATEPASGTPAAADPDTAGAPPAPTEEATATATALAPAGTGSKLPELLHAAGATSSRDMAAGTVFVAVFLASVATMYYV